MGQVTHRFGHDVATVYGALTDIDHMTRRCHAFDQRNVECDFDEHKATLTLARDIESDIPAFAKKVVDPVNRVKVIMRWEDDGEGKRCAYHVDVSPRIGIDGHIQLVPDGDGTRYEDRFEAKVKIPIVGGKVAKLVEEETKRGIENDCRWTSQELAKG